MFLEMLILQHGNRLSQEWGFQVSNISKSNSYSTFMLQCPLSCLENKLSFMQHVFPRYLSACCGFRNAAVDEQSTWQQTGNFYHQSTVDSWLTYSAKASLDPASFCSFTALPGEVKLPATQCFNFCLHVIFLNMNLPQVFCSSILYPENALL